MSGYFRISRRYRPENVVVDQIRLTYKYLLKLVRVAFLKQHPEAKAKKLLEFKNCESSPKLFYKLRNITIIKRHHTRMRYMDVEKLKMA